MHAQVHENTYYFGMHGHIDTYLLSQAHDYIVLVSMDSCTVVFIIWRMVGICVPSDANRCLPVGHVYNRDCGRNLKVVQMDCFAPPSPTPTHPHPPKPLVMESDLVSVGDKDGYPSGTSSSGRT